MSRFVAVLSCALAASTTASAKGLTGDKTTPSPTAVAAEATQAACEDHERAFHYGAATDSYERGLKKPSPPRYAPDRDRRMLASAAAQPPVWEAPGPDEPRTLTARQPPEFLEPAPSAATAPETERAPAAESPSSDEPVSETPARLATPDPWAAPSVYRPRGGMPDGMRLMLYDSEKKNEAAALAIELFLPGVGSLYADHAEGALITWACLIGGIVVLVNGLAEDGAADGSRRDSENTITLGLGLLAGGRIWGFYDSWNSTKIFNQRLRMRLGLSEGIVAGLAPAFGSPSGVAYGPSLHLRF